MLRYILIPILLFSFCFSLMAQETKIDSLKQLLNTSTTDEEATKIHLQLAKALERINLSQAKVHGLKALQTQNDSIKSEAHNQLGRGYFYTNQLDSAEYQFKKSIASLKDANAADKTAAVQISLGAVQLRKGSYKNAVQTLITSASFFEKVGDSINMGKCYNNISSAFGELQDVSQAIVYGKKALHIFKTHKMVPFQAITLPNLAVLSLKSGDTIQAKSYFLEAENIAKARNDKFSLARIYNNLGNIYLESDYALSDKYLSHALAIRKEIKNNDGIGTLYNNLGYLNLNKKNYSNALQYLDKALPYSKGSNRVVVLNNLSQTNHAMGNTEKGIRYSRAMSALNDSIHKAEIQDAVAKISIQYETAQKEKEILNLQNMNLITDTKRIQNRNLFLGVLSLLGLTIILGYLWLKNVRKKKVIAEQAQELEKQKVDRLLKDQELIGLEAMIEGQENERQRIAGELHDSLGGKLSALKLFVEEIKDIDASLHKRLKNVLDESYEDVRNIAYEKNSSVMVDKGLIPAVKKVAQRIKSSKQLEIDVINIDLKQKIKGMIALQLFRIIQELLTNTIKHAKAKTVNIQFSEDNNILNVLFEDDGVGYDLSKTKNGLGLTSVENRLQKINGSFVVDSTPGNGISVIINAPI